MKRALIIVGIGLGVAAALGVCGNYGATLYYATGHGSACADCHEMAMDVSAVHGSPHYNAQCADCHEASIGTKVRHVRAHLFRTHKGGKDPEAVRLREVDVRGMMSKCRQCHQHEYASWRAGPHSASYADIFTNAAHNTKRRLMDDCFRCHGMYFEGGMRDLVQTQDLRGPWRLTRPALASEPTIPCQSCHWIHREGPAQSKPELHKPQSGPAIRDSLAFYDRREEMHFRTASLALPQLYDGAQLLKVSPDPRQGLCYQCHAPRQPDAESIAATHNWRSQAGSGDDRTPMGVHEGLSCFACHGGHNEDARASCATCHPAMSHCGIAVDKMDTTFANTKSTHNIHWVKCTDCHQHGVPKPRTHPLALLLSKYQP